MNALPSPPRSGCLRLKAPGTRRKSGANRSVAWESKVHATQFAQENEIGRWIFDPESKVGGFYCGSSSSSHP